jgi:phenylacetate-CoA ligase
MTGRGVMAAFDELRRTQWLSRDELQTLQRRKLRALVEYANQYVPYYRRFFKEAGFEPGDLSQDPDCFGHLPTTDKAAVRNNTDDLFTTDPRRRETMQQHSTSGSTGAPLVFWEDSAYRDYVTADILRHMTWSGWSLGEPHVYLWGLGPGQSLKQRVRSALMDWALNRTVHDSLVLSEEAMRDLVEDIRRRKSRLLFGYASSLYYLAQYVRQVGRDGVQLQAIFSSAEVLYPQQRQYVEETFGCRVFDRYGALETGGLACECAVHAGMHASIENCVIEILDGDRPVPPGESGQVIVTNLNNLGFPFIRYRLDDIAQLGSRDDCPCGRHHPMLETVEGRRCDLFRTRDGRMVRGFAQAALNLQGIKQFQITQKSLDLILIRIVAEPDFSRSQLEVIERSGREVMGADTQIRFEFCDTIPLEGSGKFRYSKTELEEPPQATTGSQQ